MQTVKRSYILLLYEPISYVFGNNPKVLQPYLDSLQHTQSVCGPLKAYFTPAFVAKSEAKRRKTGRKIESRKADQAREHLKWILEMR